MVRWSRGKGLDDVGIHCGGQVKKSILILVALTAATTGIARIVAAQTPDPLDPVRVAATSHKLAFENRFVRVLDVHVLVGQSEPRHRHPHGMSVYFRREEAHRPLSSIDERSNNT